MEHPYIQANTNGRLHDAASPSLSVLDRSFLHGDSVYEVWRTYDGAIFAYDEHWERLARSAAALHLTLPFDAAGLRRELLRTAQAFVEQTGHVGPLYLRAQISRGAGPLGLDPALAGPTTFVILAQRLRLPRPDKLRAGLILTIARELRRNPPESLNPAWKTGNGLNVLLGLREARARGADDVLLLNHEGQVTEASSSNVFFVRKNAIVTPPLSSGLLGGITRRWMIERIAPRLGVTALEEPVRPADLAYFDSCFLTSTTRDLSPVAAIDEHRFHVDDLALVWKLKAAFQNFASDYAATRADLRVGVPEPAAVQ